MRFAAPIVGAVHANGSAQHPVGRDVAGQAERATDVLVVDEPSTRAIRPPEPGGEPARLQVIVHQRQEVVGAVVGVGGDPDGVDPVGAQPAAEEAADETGDAEVLVAEQVRDHVADPPPGAQRRRVPLGGGERGEQGGEIGPLGAGQARRVHGGGHGGGHGWSATVLA